MVSSMADNDNVQSHPRFKAKFVNDLQELHDNSQHAKYIARFRQFKKLNRPDDRFVNYYFEALMHEKLYYYIIDYALERMQQGVGDYEDNMSFLLKAMLEEGRYDEVLDFTAHLTNENIPHRFRMFIFEIRHAANERLGKLRERRRHIEAALEDPIDTQVFMIYSKEQRLTFIAGITKDKNAVHRETMREVLNKVHDNTLMTAILIYLKTIGDNEVIVVTKHKQTLEIVPALLPDLEETILGSVVLRDVMAELEGNAPDIMELAQSLIISVMMNIYPIEPPFDSDRLSYGFLKYIHNIVNLPYQDIGDDAVIAWIERHFET